MTTIETILSRMMNDQVFAEALLTNPAEALAEYDLSADEIEKLKGLSRMDVAARASDVPEARKSMSMSLNFTKVQFNDISMGSSTDR